ncbi:L-type lectin-domain containing receptor kinase IV.1-like [Hordeum vulgare]|uniref:non-specific serine/threonine protein kinase n=2 Tax=Hordeum vulgare subsp. vulgare TaxID=112509 RepID=A0A8I6Y6U5_HORVV|nr:L-type lectin-domain containing receptor kinase IV.1-like [Hordeum vulgare]
MKQIRLLLLHLLYVGLSLADGDDQFVYSGFGGTNLTLDGVGVTADGMLELTNGTLQRKGHAFYPAPLRFRNGTTSTFRSFSASFVFGILSDHVGLSAHGMAFVVAAGLNFSDALPSGYLGLLNVQSNGNASNRLVAVELDTMQNDEFGDINDNHVGIDVNSLSSVQSYYAGYYDDGSVNGDFRNLTLISGEAMQVLVEYDGEATQMNVTVAPLNVAKPTRPLVSARHDLSKVLTDVAYVGFSAATGGTLRSRHYVLGWSFGLNRPAPAIDISKLPRLPRVGSNDRSRALTIALPIATATFLLAGAAAIFVLVRRHRRYAELLEEWEVEFGPHRFSYKDLFRATEGFKSDHLLGIGGFGRVYKGVLPLSKSEIAVKRVSHDSKQGMKEFIAEVVSLGRLQHRNLVQLLGYCRRKGELLLVYDNMCNGSLDKYLHASDDRLLVLDWATRFRIIKGIASGLVYLHHEWEKVVIHRDIKASNVLLDNEMKGRLGDFGLARLYDHGAGADPQTTRVVGTLGYIAPELGRNGKASPGTDVFAFGVFMLRLRVGSGLSVMKEQTIRPCWLIGCFTTGKMGPFWTRWMLGSTATMVRMRPVWC